MFRTWNDHFTTYSGGYTSGQYLHEQGAREKHQCCCECLQLPSILPTAVRCVQTGGQRSLIMNIPDAIVNVIVNVIVISLMS